MENWRKVWRDGFQPSISTAGLTALRDALRDDDLRLTQGVTMAPSPLLGVQDWPCEGACGVSFAGWIGNGLQTVGEVEVYFARLCFEADQRLGEPRAVWWFLNWFDNMPRDEMRRELLVEVKAELIRRQTAETDTVPAADLYLELGVSDAG